MLIDSTAGDAHPRSDDTNRVMTWLLILIGGKSDTAAGRARGHRERTQGAASIRFAVRRVVAGSSRVL
jgi:hypothetical protein